MHRGEPAARAIGVEPCGRLIRIEPNGGRARREGGGAGGSEAQAARSSGSATTARRLGRIMARRSPAAGRRGASRRANVLSSPGDNELRSVRLEPPSRPDGRRDASGKLERAPVHRDLQRAERRHRPTGYQAGEAELHLHSGRRPSRSGGPDVCWNNLFVEVIKGDTPKAADPTFPVESQANSGTNQYDASIGMEPNGTFVIAYTQDNEYSDGSVSNQTICVRTFAESTDTAGPVVAQVESDNSALILPARR